MGPWALEAAGRRPTLGTPVSPAYTSETWFQPKNARKSSLVRTGPGSLRLSHPYAQSTPPGSGMPMGTLPGPKTPLKKFVFALTCPRALALGPGPISPFRDGNVRCAAVCAKRNLRLSHIARYLELHTTKLTQDLFLQLDYFR